MDFIFTWMRGRCTGTKKVFFMGFVWVSGCFASYGQQHNWTLQECVSYALDHNIDIKQIDLDVERAAIGKQGAWGSFLPTLSAQSSHSWTLGLNQNITTGLLENQTTQFTSAGVDVGIDIFKGLQNQNQLLKARLSVLSSKYQSQKMREDVALNVINAYLQIIFNKELNKTNQAQLTYENQQLLRSQELVAAGVVPAGDLLDIKATVASTQQKLIAAENNLLISRLALAQLLHIDDFQSFDIADQAYEVAVSEVLFKSAEEILEQAKISQIDLRLAQTKVDIAEREVAISRGVFLPSIRGFYSLATRAAYNDRIVGQTLDPNFPTRVIGVVENTNQNVVQPNMLPIISGPESLFDQFDNNMGQSFGVGISIPIFNGWSARNNVRMNKVNLEQTKNEKEVADLKLKQAVYTAYTDTQSALKSFEAAKVTLEARNLSLDYAKERYEVGLMNIFELNQVQTLAVNAQSEVLRAKYDYIFKTKILEYYFGIPIFDN
ncbi:TolC family protein [Flavobacterium sp. JP2137]|uniref:TolC family protein n=1 Tax=Flavobacterium sp. JP2137 TaxID=3414510 RepID=UPI003D2FCC97